MRALISFKKFESLNSRNLESPSSSLLGNLILHFFLNVFFKIADERKKAEVLSTIPSHCTLINN